MSTLTLVLPLVRPTVATEFDYVLSSDGHSVSQHGTAPMALLPRADTLIVALPAQALSWHRVRLPPVASHRLRAVIDGLLEEHVLDDAANMGYALAPDRLDDGQALVAAFDRNGLRAALEFFEQSRRPVTRVVPEFAPVAPQEHAIRVHVTGTAQDAMLVLREPAGVTRLAVATALSVLAAPLAQAERLVVVAEPAVADLAEQALGQTVQVQPRAQTLLDAGQCRWDLAQFDLSLRGHGRVARRWRQRAHDLLHAPSLRAARWGVLALLLVQLIGLNAWAWKLDAAVQDKRAQVTAVLARTFPKVRTIVDAPLQMQREVSALRLASGGLSRGDMESMLAALGHALPPNAHATAIDFAPGQLTARGITLLEPQFVALRDRLTVVGYTVQRESDRLVVRAGQLP